MQWEVDSEHRFVRRQDGGPLYRVGLDHSLAPHDDAHPHPAPQPPWKPCHLVDWSPPTRRTAGDTARPTDSGDAATPVHKKDRPYFLAALADITIAPDIYTYNDDEDHNLMEYLVSLGTERLLETQLLKQGRITLATGHPIAIPRWFDPGYTHTEATEHAVITEAQRLRTAQRDHIDHPAWITRTSPQPLLAITAASQPTGPAHSQPTCPDLPTPAVQPNPSPLHPSPPAPPTPPHRLPCFIAITGPQPSMHAMVTRAHVQRPRPHTPPRQPHRQRPPRQDDTTPAVASKYRRCWDQLCSTNIRKADVAVAWRALHCQLRTPSFLTYCRYKHAAVEMSGDTPMQRSCCRWPACRTPLTNHPDILQPTTIANATHVLLHCPLTRPAAQWLCDLWAAIDGANTPPATPDVIIAGDPTVWHPNRLDLELWTRLRVTYLQKAWDAHCAVHHGGPAPSPTSIAAATLHSAIQSMRTEFIAAFTAPTELAQQCDAHMTGARQGQGTSEDNNPVTDFNRIWAASGLCSVNGNNLIVRWTTTYPVPLPAAHAQPQSRPEPQPQPCPGAPPPLPPHSADATLPRLQLI